MIVAIVAAGSGVQPVVGMLTADSLEAALTAFVATYDPPLNPGDFVAVDAAGFDAANPWRTYNQGTAEFAQADDALTLLKARRCVEIDERTVELIFEGFVFASKVFSLSLPAQSYWTNMYVAREILTATGAFPLKVNALDDLSTHEIANAVEAAQFYATAVGTVKARLGSGTTLKDAVRAATTQAEVDAVVDSR